MTEVKRFISGNSYEVGQKITFNGKKYLIVAKYWKNSELCDYDFVEIKGG